jgi:hypothetical protein
MRPEHWGDTEFAHYKNEHDKVMTEVFAERFWLSGWIHGGYMGNALRVRAFLLVPFTVAELVTPVWKDSNYDHLRFFAAFVIFCAHQPTTVDES